MASAFPEESYPPSPPTYSYTPPTEQYPLAAEAKVPSTLPPTPPTASESPRPGRAARTIAVIVLCLASGVGGGLIVRASSRTGSASISAGSNATVPAVPGSGGSASSSIPVAPAPAPAAGSVAAVARSAKPSVVTIQTRQGLGSGVIISGDGEIITNEHVVSGSSTVTVTLADGTSQNGQVVGGDSDVDIAVVKINRNALPAAPLGSARSLESGDAVVAVGNPLGLDGSVSSGVVSALGRNLPDGSLRALIQTDAAINPGNSGGALLDSSGKVVGITAARLPGVGIQSIGFAIPIDVAKSVADALVAGRKPSHPYLGIVSPPVEAPTARALGSQPGARLDEVAAGTPAAEAGLKKGDVITSIDGAPITSAFDLTVILGTHRAGDALSLGLSDGRTVRAVLVERPASPNG
jgi:S1-C subfamily serine protease